ncbi:hypothetical protein C8F01DRAFT_1190879 [Mycena amicta]|nr:hypothetical protein C8F01DRAFT_1190879 [Mycena amicta]
MPHLFKLPVSTLVAALLLDANSPLQARLDVSGCPQSFHLQAAAIPLAGKRQVIVNFQVIRDHQIPKLAGVVKQSAPRRCAPPLSLSARRAWLCAPQASTSAHTHCSATHIHRCRHLCRTCIVTPVGPRQLSSSSSLSVVAAG